MSVVRWDRCLDLHVIEWKPEAKKIATQYCNGNQLNISPLTKDRGTHYCDPTLQFDERDKDDGDMVVDVEHSYRRNVNTWMVDNNEHTDRLLK